MSRLSDEIVALLRQPSTCYIATIMPDGSPQVTQVWVDSDGEHVVINSVMTHVKVKNMRRDPRVAVAVSSPNDPSSYVQIRGHVSNMSTTGGVEHIEMLSQRYTGEPYAWYGGRQQVRVMITITADHVSGIW